MRPPCRCVYVDRPNVTSSSSSAAGVSALDEAVEAVTAAPQGSEFVRGDMILEEETPEPGEATERLKGPLCHYQSGRVIGHFKCMSVVTSHVGVSTQVCDG